MDIEPITGVPTRFRPGRVEIRLSEEHRKAYRALYARYRSVIDGLPVLREGDFDGRPVTVTVGELQSLNRGLAGPAAAALPGATAFEAQARGRSRLFRKLQYLV